MRIAGLEMWWDLIREGEVFIKNKTQIACRMSGIEWRVDYFRKLLFHTNNEKFSLRRVKSKKICGHPGGNLFLSGLEVGDAWVKVTRMEWDKSGVSSAQRWRLRESEEMSVLSAVVYMTKSRGPTTEPWGTPEEEICSVRREVIITFKT